MQFQNWLILETLLDKYTPHIQEFMQENPDLVRLSDPKSANCGEVATKLARFLIARNIPAEVLCGYGFTGELGEDPNPYYAECPLNAQCGFYHIVVKTNDAVIDLTGRQFGKSFRGPRVVPLEDFLKTWNKTQEMPSYLWKNVS
jgi:hypothetical protein